MAIRSIVISALALGACMTYSPAPGGEPDPSSEIEPSAHEKALEDAPIGAKLPEGSTSPAAASGSGAEQPNTSAGKQPTTPPPAPERTEPAAGSGTPATPPPPPSAAAYPGKGFIVHEWGTNTVVSGSDGVLLRGLHHEGDDLPDFVFDRLKQGELLAGVIDKMETPVDYFYSDVPRSVTVRIDMPNGVLTQWYPAVASFSPHIFSGAGPAPFMDPVTDVHFAYATEACRMKFAQPGSGMLDWGRVDILARDTTPVLPDAPLDRFTWSYARQVAANAIRVQNPHEPLGGVNQPVTITPQSERFLFYRGLGRFEPPLHVTSEIGADGEETVRAGPNSGTLWLLRVDGDKGAFLKVESRGKAGYESPLPKLAEAQPLDKFVQNLADELIAALSGTGLYTDEAVAMVNTWRQQWFRTPGVRVLYFAPQSWFDAELPLKITPAPDQIVRVMVMRVELLTPSVETADVTAALALGSMPANPAPLEHFRALGRFAEPRLRRAITLIGTGKAPVSAQTLLTQIEGPNAAWAMGE